MPKETAIEYYSYEDYALWEGKWELIGGIPLAMSPSPTIIHQAIAANILFELKKSMGDCEQCLVLCEEDWKVSENTIVKPDVVFICNEPSDQYITLTPEIIVEVVSKSTAKRDEVSKYNLYESEKVPYYVIAYPNDKKAKIYKLEADKYRKQGDFSKQSYLFTETTCETEIDFNNVFLDRP